MLLSPRRARYNKDDRVQTTSHSQADSTGGGQGQATAFFTVCSNNYMPFARVLVQSIRQHHPEADVFVCLADETVDWPGLYDGDFVLVPADQLEIPGFRSVAFQYDIMEFNTAVKPFMFSHLLKSGRYEHVLYFDPDIRLYARLDKILDALNEGASFILVPHLREPAEGDADPDDLAIMRAGIYNLGFLAVGRPAESLPLIHWWMRRLRISCINRQSEGIFVDQKFMDLIPGFAPHARILHDREFNLAYWNISQSHLAATASGYTVDDAPLGFFHFSGFDPRKPDILSKHSRHFRDRAVGAISGLCRDYASDLLLHGWGTIPAALYAYGRFSSGTAIPDLVRRMYIETTPDWPLDPFETYETYLHEAAPGGSRDSSCFVLTHFLKFLWSHFANQRLTLDLRHGEHLRHQILWYIQHARREQHLDHRLIAPVAARVGRHAFPDSARTRGGHANRAAATVIGYLRTVSGVGNAGRQVLAGLAAGGLKVEGLDVALGVVSDRSDTECEPLLRERATGRVQIFAVNADQLPQVAAHVQPQIDEPGYRISIPFWELEHFPDAWVGAFDLVDEVWAPTAWIQTMLVRKLDKPVLCMPPPLTLTPPPAARRTEFGLPGDRFLFYVAFDFLSFIERKNPKACIEAFRLLRRTTNTDAMLVIKTMNGLLAPEALQDFLSLVAGDPGIILIDRVLTRTQTLQLTALCDAVLSLHRCEGLGLVVAEAMALGRPVIATDYSATTELVTPATGYPVAYSLVKVQPGQYPMAADQLWAEPDTQHAAWLMHRVMADPVEVQAKVDAARAHLDAHYSPAVVRARQMQRLAELSVAA